MRPFAGTTCVFLCINLMLFLGLFWITRKITQIDVMKETKVKPHLRIANTFEIPVAPQEEVKRDPRFSVVIVTHKEVLLEKTYPTQLVHLS